MFKKWLAVLGAVVFVVCTFSLLWGAGGGGDEYPWHGTTGGSGTGSTKVSSSSKTTQTSNALTRIYIVRPAPMGGFYLIRISLPSGASVKTAAGVKKVED